MTLSLKSTQWTIFKFSLKKKTKIKQICRKTRLLEVLLDEVFIYFSNHRWLFQIFEAQEILNPKRWLNQVHIVSRLHITCKLKGRDDSRTCLSISVRTPKTRERVVPSSSSRFSSRTRSTFLQNKFMYTYCTVCTTTFFKLCQRRRSVADPGCLYRNPDPNFSIPDPGSRVKKIPDPGSA